MSESQIDKTPAAEDELESVIPTQKPPEDSAEDTADDSEPETPDCSEYIQKAKEWEARCKRALADYDNLKKRSAADIQKGINAATDGIMQGFLEIYDDFVRARDVYAAKDVKTDDLDLVVKNADVFLKKTGVTVIEPLGDVFDTDNQESVRYKVDPDLAENIVTAVLRKGYIVNDRVLRTALVEISRKNGDEK